MKIKIVSVLGILFLAGLLGAWYYSQAGIVEVPGIVIEDAYARSNGPSAKTGAVFMRITNNTELNEKLVGVKADVAMKAELHTHIHSDDGVVLMRHVMNGFEIPAKEQIVLKRGGDHLMLMGLSLPLEQGDVIHLILSFKQAGDIALDVSVDLER